MKRRKFVVGLGSLAAGGAAVTGTGAFSDVMAERSTHITVAPDSGSGAYLTLTPTSGYAQMGAGNKLAINLNDNNPGAEGDGVNGSAVTEIDSLFSAKNAGDRQVKFWIQEDGFSFGNPPNGLSQPDAVDFYRTSDQHILTPKSNAVTLGVGNAVSVGIRVDTEGITAPDSLGGSIMLHAEAT